ncbi:MAG: octanoyltransferase, partial [Gammaproteobacteria bacterium]|nr:octanoyltransferase [Gammaproteobacteria bacterium]
MPVKQEIHIKHLGLCNYGEVWDEMQCFTASRTDTTRDEIWLLEHPPVFTLGLAGKREHLLNPGSIPVVQSDRGGQVT